MFWCIPVTKTLVFSVFPLDIKTGASNMASSRLVVDINLFACRSQKLKLAFEIVVSEEKFSFVMKQVKLLRS